MAGPEPPAAESSDGWIGPSVTLTRSPARAYALAVAFNLAYAALWLYRAHRFLDSTGEGSRSRWRPTLYALGGSLGSLLVLPMLLAVALTARKLRRAENAVHEGGWPTISPWKMGAVVVLGYTLVAVTVAAKGPGAPPVWTQVALAVAAIATLWFPFFILQRHMVDVTGKLAQGASSVRPHWARWASPLVALYAALSLLAFINFSDLVRPYAVRGARVSDVATCNARIVTVPMLYEFGSPARGDTVVAQRSSGPPIVGVIVGIPGDDIEWNEPAGTLSFAGGPPQSTTFLVPEDWADTVPDPYYMIRVAREGSWDLDVFERDELVGPAVMRYTPSLAAISLHDKPLLQEPASPACA